MEKIKDFIYRNAFWFIGGLISFALLQPGLSEIRSILFLILIEFLALALAGIAVFAYTKVDFTKEISRNSLGQIFLGVHFLVGLSIIGVYYVM